MAFRNLLPEIWRGEHPWNREMSRLQRRIDHMFDEALTEPFPSLFRAPRELTELEQMQFVPPCDVEETDKQYLIGFDVPGIKKEDVKIELRDNQLIVSGERKQERKEETKGRISQERYYGSFMRSFTLPSNISPEKIEANYDNGVLQIVIPKTAVTQGKQIPVKEAKLIETKAGKAA